MSDSRFYNQLTDEIIRVSKFVEKNKIFYNRVIADATGVRKVLEEFPNDDVKKQNIELFEELISIEQSIEKSTALTDFFIKSLEYLRATQLYLDRLTDTRSFIAKHNNLVFTDKNAIIAFVADNSKMTEYNRLVSALKSAIQQLMEYNTMLPDLLKKSDSDLSSIYPLRQRRLTLKNKVDALLNNGKDDGCGRGYLYISKALNAIESDINLLTSDDKTPSKDYLLTSVAIMARYNQFINTTKEGIAILKRHGQLCEIRAQLAQAIQSNNNSNQTTTARLAAAMPKTSATPVASTVTPAKVAVASSTSSTPAHFKPATALPRPLQLVTATQVGSFSPPR